MASSCQGLSPHAGSPGVWHERPPQAASPAVSPGQPVSFPGFERHTHNELVFSWVRKCPSRFAKSRAPSCLYRVYSSTQGQNVFKNLLSSAGSLEAPPEEALLWCRLSCAYGRAGNKTTQLKITAFETPVTFIVSFGFGRVMVLNLFNQSSQLLINLSWKSLTTSSY